MIYTLSKDYEKLYQLVKSGETVVCFVDHRWVDGEISRDICKCTYSAEYEDFVFGVRGTQYGGVYSFSLEDPGNWDEEKKLFLSECQRMNVEWIVPNN